jgi:hypothetical protein
MFASRGNLNQVQTKPSARAALPGKLRQFCATTRKAFFF